MPPALPVQRSDCQSERHSRLSQLPIAKQPPRPFDTHCDPSPDQPSVFELYSASLPRSCSTAQRHLFASSSKSGSRVSRTAQRTTPPVSGLMITGAAHLTASAVFRGPMFHSASLTPSDLHPPSGYCPADSNGFVRFTPTHLLSADAITGLSYPATHPACAR